MKKYLSTFILTSAVLMSNEILDLESDFLQSLDEVSEIATKTKLNIDDTPSFVTVLHSEKLQKLGINNVFEALRLVPGVQLTKESTGVPVVVFRGATQKGEVKLMIDGVNINNTYRGSIYHYLDFPIELIQRIEVIRGAGSVLYGSGAISGVINIITNSSEENKNKVFTSIGSYDHYKSGAIISQQIGNVKFLSDGYYEKDHKKIATGPDIAGTTGDSDQSLTNYSIGLNISNENISLITRMKSSDFGNSHGLTNHIDEDTDKYHNLNQMFFTQLKYKNSINKDNTYFISVGYSSYLQNAETKLPANIDIKYKENSIFTQSQFVSNSIENNELIVGIEYSSSKIKDTNYFTKENATRKIFSLYLTDKYSATKKLDISAGLRYDNYKDEMQKVSPSFGAVYRVSDDIKIKTTYSKSFRVPSWIELNSNANLSEEEASTIESGIVYNYNQNNKIRVNFFKTEIKNVIAKNSARIYENSAEHNMLGSEFEYIFSPNIQSEMKFSTSYIDAKDKDNNDIKDVANILTNASFIYRFDSGISLGMLLKYTSSIDRSSTDKRDDMSNSLIFDQSISYVNKSFTTTLTIKDLFNHGTNYPLVENTYINDYQDASRTIQLKASWEF